MLISNNVVVTTWQGGRSRTHFPIGRLLELPTEIPNPREYEFVYTRGVEQAVRSGFQYFRGLDDPTQVYRSHELHPVFKNRLMPESRPDYGDFVRRIGLEPSVATPIEILGRGAGSSPTDNLELFTPPMYDAAQQRWVYFFPVRGVRFVPGAEERIARLAPGERLWLAADVQNDVDRDAILLRTQDVSFAGYVPQALSADVCRLLQLGAEPEARVTIVNRPPFPSQLRLFCTITARAVPGFEPLSAAQFQPIPAHATRLEWNQSRLAS